MDEDERDFEERFKKTIFGLGAALGGKRVGLLHKLGYEQMADLAKTTEHEINSLSGFGPKMMEKINAAMAEQGLEWQPPPAQRNLLPRIYASVFGSPVRIAVDNDKGPK